MTLFILGLFKKVVLADGIAPLVSSIYDQAASGTTISFFPAWMAAVGFTLQIYFDFSGYTDMALGAARVFGIRLPPNFDSPLRASSIIEFWSRWHITLTRFLTAYIYNPLVLSLTRRRLARRRHTGGSNSVSRFVELLVFPTLLTMLISGAWHGAGFLFILWGAVHGVFIVVNHAWRQFGPRGNHVAYASISQPVGFALTAVCVAASMVIFRSTTMSTATELFQGMVGLHGVALPESLYDKLGPVTPLLQRAGITSGLSVNLPFTQMALWIVALGGIAFASPNTLQLLRVHEPALNWKADRSKSHESPYRVPAWQPSAVWAAAVSVVAALAILRLGGPSEFLYWQF